MSLRKWTPTGERDIYSVRRHWHSEKVSDGPWKIVDSSCQHETWVPRMVNEIDFLGNEKGTDELKILPFFLICH